MELDLHGEVFSLDKRDYDFQNDKGERVQGTSHTATVLDFNTRTVHTVKIPAQHVDALGLALDEHVDWRVTARANGNRMSLSFVQAIPAP